jgi:hypothetical protein
MSSLSKHNGTTSNMQTTCLGPVVQQPTFRMVKAVPEQQAHLSHMLQPTLPVSDQHEVTPAFCWASDLEHVKHMGAYATVLGLQKHVHQDQLSCQFTKGTRQLSEPVNEQRHTDKLVIMHIMETLQW